MYSKRLFIILFTFPTDLLSYQYLHHFPPLADHHMNGQPLISILTPTWNRAGTYLAENIRFIQKQREQGFTHEHIIVDNASEDNTEELVRDFMKDDPRIKYVRNETNMMASGALNVAFSHSQGDIIVPFDDDDIMPGMSLQARFDSLKNPKILWSVGQALMVGQDGQLRDSHSSFFEFDSPYIRPFLDENNELKPEEAHNFFLAFFRGWIICNGTVSIRRHCIEEVGGWNPEFKSSQDTDMWIKLASKYYPLKLINDYLILYRTHPGQISKQNSKNGTMKNVASSIRAYHGITEESFKGVPPLKKAWEA